MAINSFTPEQEAFIEKIAWTVSEKIFDRMILAMQAQIAAHVGDCTTTKRLRSLYCVVIGIAIGFGLGGGGIGYAIGLAKVASAVAP